MKQTEKRSNQVKIKTFTEFMQRVDYSLMESLHADPKATDDGHDHRPRQVLSGHYVPVKPTALPSPKYVAHSKALFDELGLSHTFAHDEDFRSLFSGDLSITKEPMKPYGWATGYALSIYGTEYIQQCPFQTGNGYGDGRAISIFEGVFNNGKRWEMQLKGAGATPYCRGADGRAVLRSSVREFLAQELMHALGIPTSRSLTLYVSQSETVYRPWYSPNSMFRDPDIMVDNSAAITTRVAPSFLRVGQLELFARRVRKNEHPAARSELKMIVEHLIERNYSQEIDESLTLIDQIVELAKLFRTRLISLVAHWIRVGYCQGNFNSDNCAAGGFTLDYGPFGFCEMFDPRFQPWTGGGHHFSFLNQPNAARVNFKMFCKSLRPLLVDHPEALAQLNLIWDGFAEEMNQELESMWARKLGVPLINAPSLLNELLNLMIISKVDYTAFFRTLSDIPDDFSALRKSFYQTSLEQSDTRWQAWFKQWYECIMNSGISKEEISHSMKQSNPNVTWREWLIVPAYEHAELGDYSLIHELQELFSNPYSELPLDLAAKYDNLRPKEFFNTGGVSHYSCSS